MTSAAPEGNYQPGAQSLADVSETTRHRYRLVVVDPDPASAMHIGRSWSGTAIEDTCPCPKAPCGLVVFGHDGCGEHSVEYAKSIRQGHRAEDCPALAPSVIPAPTRQV